jgi:ATP-binding cassette subfamily B protein
VAEQGGHDELMALDGRYAQLFRLQADRFSDIVEVAEG